jgi:hypothetical protein
MTYANDIGSDVIKRSFLVILLLNSILERQCILDTTPSYSFWAAVPSQGRYNVIAEYQHITSQGSSNSTHNHGLFFPLRYLQLLRLIGQADAEYSWQYHWDFSK